MSFSPLDYRVFEGKGHIYASIYLPPMSSAVPSFQIQYVFAE